MLQKLDTKFSAKTILENLPNFSTEIDSEDFMQKTFINEPTGDFFYDPWQLKNEFKKEPIVNLFNQLGPVGQARIIVIKPGYNYPAHADIDDRYHVTLQGEHSYLIDLDNFKMYPTLVDDCCYLMDTARVHTAANFGYMDRIQLVIRKLLHNVQLKDPVNVKLKLIDPPYNWRYLFDQTVSVWLNLTNKKNLIKNFKQISEYEINFVLEKICVNELETILKKVKFEYKIIYG